MLHADNRSGLSLSRDDNNRGVISGLIKIAPKWSEIAARRYNNNNPRIIQVEITQFSEEEKTNGWENEV